MVCKILFCMECGYCLMCKINGSVSFYYVLFWFLYGLSYLVMWSFVVWSFNLTMRSLYLVMCTSHLVIIYFLGYVLLPFSSALFLFSYPLLSFHYVLFPLFALLMRSLYWLCLCIRLMRFYYVLFICALCIRFLNGLFLWRLSRSMRIEELKVS